MANPNADLNDDLLPGLSGEFRFQEYLALLLRGKWIIVFSVALLTGVMLVYTLNVKPAYEASSLVLINPKEGAQRVPIGTSGDDGSPNKVANELGILKSRSVAELVASDLIAHPYLDEGHRELLPLVRHWSDGRPTGVIAQPEEVTPRLQNSMDFTPERESDIIRISATSSDPREAAVMANGYADVYRDYIMDVSRARSKSLREFLESRVADQGVALSRAEASLKSFLESSGIVSMDGESTKLVQELSQLEATRNGLDIDIQTETQKLASLQKDLPRQESNVANSIGEADDPYIHLLQEQLARLEVQRDVITVQNDPKVLGQEMYAQKLGGIANQIAALREKLKERTMDFIGTTTPGETGSSQSDPLKYLRSLKEKILETRLDIVTLQSRREALQNIIAGYESRFQKIPAQSLDLARLQRERTSAEKLYLIVEEKFNEAAIAEKSEFGNVEVIDRASVPGSPVSPNLRLNLLLGILAGLGVGMVVVILRDVLDARVRTPEQLRRKGYGTLAEVAPMDEELRRLAADDGISGEIRRFDQHLWMIFNPFSLVAESYRRLRTNLLRAQRDDRLQVLLMSGPNPQEGKTTTLCNLAMVLAETQKRVLVIDADLRKPRVHALLNLPAEPGLTDLLAEEATREKVIHRGLFENLDVICSGSPCKHPSGVFAGKRFGTVIEELRRLYDWVLIDSPPTLIVNDAAVISAIADGTILTVSTGRTRMAALQRASDFLTDAGGRVVGVVLNNFNAQQAYGVYYGGQHYGHYGNKNRYYGPTNGKQKLASQA